MNLINLLKAIQGRTLICLKEDLELEGKGEKVLFKGKRSEIPNKYLERYELEGKYCIINICKINKISYLTIYVTKK